MRPDVPRGRPTPETASHKISAPGKATKATVAQAGDGGMRPRALDLFCCGGGAAYGLHLAGDDVTGVDLAPQPRFPFTFRQADALTFPLDGYDLIWASPPCQGYTAARHLRGRDHPMLIGPVRERLAASGIPYVIENVEGAPLTDPVTLCGTMFGLKTYRHRLFEASFPLDQPAHQPHTGLLTSDIGRPPLPGDYITAVGHFSGADYGRAALGIWWMTVNELRESIPPAYSAMIGLAAAAKFGYELPPAVRNAGRGSQGTGQRPGGRADAPLPCPPAGQERRGRRSPQTRAAAEDDLSLRGRAGAGTYRAGRPESRRRR